MTWLAKNSGILAAAAMIFLTGAGVRAAGVEEMGYFAPGAANQAATATTQVAALRSAYSTLAGANHNYGNHRLLAMQAIAQACSILGANVTGGGNGGEWQMVSDLQLHAAQATLQLARAGIPAGHQPRVAALMDTAINQISLALAVN